MHPYVEFINPFLGARLEKIGMDKTYVKGEGCFLYDDQDRQYLDFIASYGALPFGYNDSRIWNAVETMHTLGEPSFSQPSMLEAAGALAKRLVSLAPGDLSHVTFTNSGAEAVEAAVKLVRAHTQRTKILSTHNSFHGKTMGALSATGNSEYQEPFGLPAAGFEYIPFGDAGALEAVFEARAEEFAGFIVEPIQGEGGIIVPPDGYLRQIRGICDEYDVPLIFDEIQTGLGRTGELFACMAEEVTPDVLLLAKALGGGLVPIGAALCTEDVYSEDFGLKHSSTFAANTLACRVGLAALDILTGNDGQMLQAIRSRGEYLREKLDCLQKRYPDILREVRGRGLMLGLDFGSSRDLYPDSMLGVLAEQGILTPLISSFLLNTQGLRVAPTLNGASVIRIEPPLIVTEEQIDQAVTAIEKVLETLKCRHTGAFLAHLVGLDVSLDELPVPKEPSPKVVPSDDDEEGRFGFLIHPLGQNNYSDFDTSLQVFSEKQLAELSSRWSDFLDPFLVGSTRIKSADGSTAFGDFIGVPRTADQLQELPREQVLSELTKAVNMAVERGAQIVGLGAYTSVVTVGGRSLLSLVDVPLTTGNSYTVVSGVEALTRSAERLGIQLSESTAAVVGAGGAIGKASAVLLAEEVQRLVLLGNPDNPKKSRHRALKVTAEILRHVTALQESGRSFAPKTAAAQIVSSVGVPSSDAPASDWMDAAKDFIQRTDCSVVISVDAGRWLPEADLVLAATSSVDAIITHEMLKWGAVVCDMSRPTNVSEAVQESRPDVLVVDGGLIEVPGRPDLGCELGFEKGIAYACMSETMMLSLEHMYENASIGADLNQETLRLVRSLAAKHGFGTAALRSFGEILSDDVWQEKRRLRSTGYTAARQLA